MTTAQPIRSPIPRLRQLAIGAIAALLVSAGAALVTPGSAEASSITFRGKGFSVTIGDSHRYRAYPRYRSHRGYSDNRHYRSQRYAYPQRYHDNNGYNHRGYYHYNPRHHQVAPQFWYGPQK